MKQHTGRTADPLAKVKQYDRDNLAAAQIIAADPFRWRNIC
jgi:hypothetical protein